jgi:hypothetical protein
LEAAFLSAVIMGIVFVQNVTMLEIWNTVLAKLVEITGTNSYYVNFSITFMLAILLPVSLLGLASWVASRVNGSSALENFTRFGYAIIALDMAGHIAHNLFHLLAEGKSIFYTAAALFGVEFHGADPAILGTEAIQVLQYGLIALGFIGSMYIVYQIAKRHHKDALVWGTVAPFAALMVLLTYFNIVLFSLPMAMRM